MPRLRRVHLHRLWPLLLLALLLGAAAVGVPLSWATLAAHQAALRHFVEAAPVAAAAAYVAGYAAAVGVSVPLGALFTVVGGLLFGTVAGGGLAVLGATAGACLLFLIIRGSPAPGLAARALPLLARIGPELRRDAFSYLLAMRLMPAVPFWLGNLAAPLLGVRLGTFAAATLLGVTPATFVFAGIGAGLGSVLEAGGRPDLSLIWSPSVLGPLLGLAALSLLPVAWRRWRDRVSGRIAVRAGDAAPGPAAGMVAMIGGEPADRPG
ncbi:TVP38/TMEM64 family membrane protein [Rhodovastum atsumiense]|uniref:TVP38/TMEM64 family protein n=1 Tax=Rhodovastum atsumiense TaxID=504468 RepID=A0A5M6IXU7_9PROT|nr:VTT domain-containing protein [Rhodovastum atsumiense]KAA5613101.1 TVP38/TMEM64 family protein [Rhodovastum atsumiense]CAH2600028.1 TVP38/TMEM64 family membrane protein [Rhodovastum atsumiense]